MALGDDIKAAREELIALDGEIKGIGQRIQDGVKFQMDALNESTQKVAQSFQRDLGNAITRANKNLSEQEKIQEKILKGQDASRSIEKEITKTQKERSTVLRKIEGLKRTGVAFNEEEVLLLTETLNAQEQQLEALAALNAEQIAQRGLTGNIVENAKEYLVKLDQSGLAARLFNGELSKSQQVSLGLQAVLVGFVAAIVEATNRTIRFQQELGVSFQTAQELQKSLAVSARESGLLFVNASELNKAFLQLAESTGIVSDFGGQTLISVTSLTKQLGLGVNEATNLALLARTQNENTEDVLSNTVDTVSAFNKQNGLALNSKSIFNDIANASKAIQVSLDSNPQALAEAASAAKALGLSLNQVDQIAGSLLNFEESIGSQIQFEILSGKQLNFEKARTLALNNDIAGLSEEIKNNAELTEVFASGNRIQQEAAAKALGMGREEMAAMVQQQQFQALAQDEFIAKFGEQSYEAQQQLNTQQKFEESMMKVKELVVELGIKFAPIVESIAAFVGKLASSKGALQGLLVAAGALATFSVVAAIARIAASFAAIPLGVGIPLGFAAIAGLMASISAAKQATSSVEDGIADSARGPFTITDSYGKMAMTAQGDSLAVSPNITQGGSSGEGRMIALLEQLVNRTGDVMLDGQKVGNVLSSSYRTMSN